MLQAFCILLEQEPSARTVFQVMLITNVLGIIRLAYGEIMGSHCFISYNKTSTLFNINHTVGYICGSYVMLFWVRISPQLPIQKKPSSLV